MWASDYAENSGEGNLARLFTKYLIKRKNYKIKFNKMNNIKYNKYFSPFIGILYCWKYYFVNKNVAYINYLPLWNFFIFMFLPPKTILGPITGGAKYSSRHKLNFLIRKYLFTLFYKISECFLLLRSSEIIFSTDLLKEKLSKKLKQKSKFNFLIKNIRISKFKNKKRSIDLILYYRKHMNKESFFPKKFIRRMAKSGAKISVIGDKLNIKNIKNYGYLKNINVQRLQAQSKFTIASGENIYSIFTVECLLYNVKVLIEKKHYTQINFFKKNFLVTNFDKINL